MKQKIVIKASMHCSKCRTKALQIAAAADGVTSVALHGSEKNQLMIIGDEVDAAGLTNSLRKKFCHASLEMVEEVKPPKTEPPKTEPPKPPNPNPNPIECHCPIVCHCQQQPQVEYYRVVCEPYPPPCTIM